MDIASVRVRVPLGVHTLLILNTMFNKKSTPPKKASEVLAANTNEAINVFTVTMNKLIGISNRAKLSVEDNQKQINALEEENTKLRSIQQQNENLASKIAALLNG